MIVKNANIPVGNHCYPYCQNPVWKNVVVEKNSNRLNRHVHAMKALDLRSLK